MVKVEDYVAVKIEGRKKKNHMFLAKVRLHLFYDKTLTLSIILLKNRPHLGHLNSYRF